MTTQQRKYWQRRARFGASVLGGYGSYGTGTKATLKIGRRAGLNYAGWREGSIVPMRVVLATVLERRARQIGGNDAGYAVTETKGRYGGKSEPSVNVELVWTGAKKEPSRATFFRNVARLAQDIASDLAQREVIVEWNAPGRHGRVDTATPSKAPSALSPAFCAWVRRHSSEAKRDRDDPCFVGTR